MTSTFGGCFLKNPVKQPASDSHGCSAECRKDETEVIIRRRFDPVFRQLRDDCLSQRIPDFGSGQRSQSQLRLELPDARDRSDRTILLLRESGHKEHPESVSSETAETTAYLVRLVSHKRTIHQTQPDLAEIFECVKQSSGHRPRFRLCQAGRVPAENMESVSSVLRIVSVSMHTTECNGLAMFEYLVNERQSACTNSQNAPFPIITGKRRQFLNGIFQLIQNVAVWMRWRDRR